MDKVLAILKEANLSEASLNEMKSALDEFVKAKVSEETKSITESADAYCKRKIDSAIRAKTAQVEKHATDWCNKKAAAIAKKADKRIAEELARIEKLSNQYVLENLDRLMKEKYGEELENMEESMLQKIDKYFEYAINEKISPKLIEKQAMNEMFAPIVNGIQSLFEEQYVPLNVSGTKKLKEARATIAQLEATVQTQVDANMKLTESYEKAKKTALIAEKTSGLSDKEKARAKKFFESKSLTDTENDIDDYCDMLKESAIEMTTRRPAAMISEKTTKKRPIRLNSSVEDSTSEYISEKFKPERAQVDDIDDFLTKSSRFLED